MAAGEGEQVDIATIRQYNSLSDARLSQMRRQGLSDQRVALIDSILAARSIGETVEPSKQTVSRFAEARSVSEVQKVKAQQQFLQSKQVAVGTGARGGVLVQQKDGSVKEVFMSVPREYGGLPDEAREASLRGQRFEVSPVGGKQLTLSRAEALEQDKRDIQSKQTFSGSVKEFASADQQTPTTEKFFVRGQEVGSIQIDPRTGQRVALVRQPARLTFPDTPAGRVMEVLFGREGTTITQIGVDVPDPTPILSEEANKGVFSQSLPPLERIKIAYQSAGKTQYGEPNLRGVARAYLEFSGIVAEKIIPKSIYQSKFNFPIKSNFPEDVLLSTFLLSPTTSSTVQIEKALFEVSRVKFVGFTQQIGKTSTGLQRVTTQAGFTVERGSSFVRGIVNVKSIQNQQAVISTAKGKTFTTSYQFPTTRQIITPKQEFKAAEISQVIQKQDLFFTKSYGTIKQPKTLTKDIYRGEAVAKQFSTPKGRFIVQAGASQVEKGGLSYSLGILKLRPSGSEKIFFTPTTKGGTASLYQISKSAYPLKATSIQVAKNVVGSAVKIPPQRITRLIPITKISLGTPTITGKTVESPKSIYAGTGLYERTETISTQSFKITTTPTQRQTPFFSLGFSQRQSTKTLQITKQESIQKQLPKQIQTPIQRTSQRLKLGQLTKTIQTTEQRGRFLFRAPPRIRAPSPKPLSFFKTRTPTKTQKGLFEVLGRRFGKFKTIGYGRTELEALGIGKQFASTTLGATFKVPKSRSIKIAGFKTKFSKKEGKVFIELPKYRLSTPTEKAEIRFYRGLKGGRK